MHDALLFGHGGANRDNRLPAHEYITHLTWKLKSCMHVPYVAPPEFCEDFLT